MNSLKNRVQLIGHLGMDPEIKTLESGKKLAKFSLATNDFYKNAKGEKVEETEWHNIIAWNKTAELVENFLAKGKEVAIEAQRLGIEVIAVDKYENAPAHLVANRSYAIDMQDKEAVLALIEKEQPTYILPEVEAISIAALFEAEARGFHVIPNAEAVNKTMNRKNIRVFAAEELGLKTSGFKAALIERE